MPSFVRLDIYKIFMYKQLQRRYSADMFNIRRHESISLIIIYYPNEEGGPTNEERVMCGIELQMPAFVRLDINKIFPV